jgi:acyl-CoA-binding protein
VRDTRPLGVVYCTALKGLRKGSANHNDGIQGKYKYNAWKKVVDEKTTPETAQKEYVDLIEKLKGTYGFKE